MSAQRSIAFGMLAGLLLLHCLALCLANDEISNHIRKCCIGGLRHSRTHHNCANYEYEVAAIPPLWRGLCSSTFGVCCSRETEKQHCEAGRMAAQRGSRCSEQFNTTAYADCCRSCQVGLAVQASDNDCNDALFSYFADIESYRVCCASAEKTSAINGGNGDGDDVGGGAPNAVAAIEDSDSDTDDDAEEDKIAISNTSDGTIVLNEDDDDICGKVPNLCAHICENTKEAYRCKCNPGYKLDDNNVTCSPLTAVEPSVSAMAPVSGSTADKSKQPRDEDADDLDDDDSDVEADDDDQDDEIEVESESVAPLCPSGYEHDFVRRKCIDIDECTMQLASCKANQYCHNTVGSYHCLNIKSKTCEPGHRYTMKSEKCEDINECMEGTDDCAAGQQCLNTKGGFKCQQKGALADLQACPTGFVYSALTEKCEDYDECSDAPCESGDACVNHPGRYECKKLGTTALSKLAASVTGDKCGDGFQYRHGRCADIDECANEESVCHSSQECTNNIGSYRCDCRNGFNQDTTTNGCIDINECSINNHNCLPTQRCDNTVGSYICTRLQSCGTGYTLNSDTGNCDDDDECSLGMHNCPPAYECYNTKGSFRCLRRPPSTTTTSTSTTTSTTTTTTPPPPPPPPSSQSAYGGGYSHYRNRSQPVGVYQSPSYVAHQTNSRSHMRDYMPKYVGGAEVAPPLPCDTGFQRNQLGACVDVNECMLSNPCGSHQRCINSNGSYRCHNLLQCAAGYKSTPDGTTCIDIDECETGEHSCADNQICRNRNGGYVCSCPPGHQLKRLSASLSRCVDVNECEQEHPPVCPSNAQCLNTIGSYYCECKSGYQKSRENDRFCLDVDECQEIPGLCQQKCVNFWGGYRCTCNAGYELSADNRTCNDVDECEVHKAYKPCMGFCNNVPGSYECSCPRGYTLAMDKNTCRDVDECATGNFCTGRNDICTNKRGSFLCTTVQCPYGYTNDPDQKNRCRQSSNHCEGDECYNKPSAYTYNFITLVSKLMIPPEGRVIFSLRGPAWYDDIDFDLKIVKIQADANIEKASDNHFNTIKGKHEVHLSLRRSLEGPQDIELELSMTVFTNGMPRGKSVAKIFILVSQYTF